MMINELLRVLPRKYARGATSKISFSSNLATCSNPNISYKASYKGLKYGSTFWDKSPGKKPSFSPASTAGRIRIIFLTFSEISISTALATAR